MCWSKYSKKYHEIHSHISIYPGVPPVCLGQMANGHPYWEFGIKNIYISLHNHCGDLLACTMSSGHPSSAQPLVNRWKDCPCFSGKSRWTILFESYYNIQISKLYIDNWKSPTYFTFWLWRDWTETLSLHVSSTRSRVGWSGCNATIFPWFRCDELWSSLEWKWGNGGRKQTVVHGMKLQAW